MRHDGNVPHASATIVMRMFPTLLLVAVLLAYGFFCIYLMTESIGSPPTSLQYQLLCAFSTLLNVPVLVAHWCYPPHPKFMLLWRRLIGIRIHVVAGTVEFLAGSAALVSGESCRVVLAQVMVCAALCGHIPSAIYQTPIVFGVRAVMVPCYLLCISVHLYCAVQLLLTPSSYFWLTQTFLTFSIYAWVRLFYLAYRWSGIFKPWEYSAAVLSAGVTVAPAVLGPCSVLFLTSFVLLYVVLYWLILRPSPEEIAAWTVEHRRRSDTDDQRIQTWKLARLKAATGLGDRDGMNDKQRARKVFEVLDTDANGLLGRDEVERVFVQWDVSKSLIAEFMQHHGEVDFDSFYRHLWNFDDVVGRLHKEKPLRGRRPEDDPRALAVFQRIDFDDSGSISMWELRMLLRQWNLPERDLQDCVQKYGNQRGEIDFGVFQDSMSPIWRFAFYDVIDRPGWRRWCLID